MSDNERDRKEMLLQAVVDGDADAINPRDYEEKLFAEAAEDETTRSNPREHADLFINEISSKGRGGDLPDPTEYSDGAIIAVTDHEWQTTYAASEAELGNVYPISSEAVYDIVEDLTTAINAIKTSLENYTPYMFIDTDKSEHTNFRADFLVLFASFLNDALANVGTEVVKENASFRGTSVTNLLAASVGFHISIPLVHISDGNGNTVNLLLNGVAYNNFSFRIVLKYPVASNYVLIDINFMLASNDAILYGKATQL